jgi:hypothetical protein
LLGSNVVILYDASGNPLPVADATAIPANTPRLLVAGSDGTNALTMRLKAASTAPLATDPAIVCVLSPNQQAIPVTSSPSNATTGIAFGRVLYGGSSGVLTAVRATAYTEQTANFTGSVKSASANDTSAGTGARTIIITYYDQAGAGSSTETATLNGTTAVNLVSTTHSFIEKMVVTSVGSTGSNAGAISLFTGAGGTGTTVGSIGFGTIVSTAGDNATLWAHHYIPSSKNTFIFEISGGTTGNQTANMFLRYQAVLTANSPDIPASDFLVTASGSSTTSRSAANAIKLAGFARITMYVVSNGTNTSFFGSFDFADQ